MHIQRQTALPHAVLVDGLPTVPIDVAVASLGRWRDADAVELAVEWMLRQGSAPLADLERVLAAGFTGRPTARQIHVLRTVLAGRPLGAPATESYLETVVVQLIRSVGLPDPIRQHEVRNAMGRVVARVDLAYPALRLAIEVEGTRFHGLEHLDADADRRNFLESSGWRVLQLRWRLVMERPDEAREVLVRAYRSANGLAAVG